MRGYTFAGSSNVLVNRATARGLSSMSGAAVGYAVLTDSDRVRFVDASTRGIDAGWGDGMPMGPPNGPAYAAGFYVGADSVGSRVVRGCATGMAGYDGEYFVHDLTGQARVVAACRSNR